MFYWIYKHNQYSNHEYKFQKRRKRKKRKQKLTYPMLNPKWSFLQSMTTVIIILQSFADQHLDFIVYLFYF